MACHHQCQEAIPDRPLLCAVHGEGFDILRPRHRPSRSPRGPASVLRAHAPVPAAHKNRHDTTTTTTTTSITSTTTGSTTIALTLLSSRGARSDSDRPSCLINPTPTPPSRKTPRRRWPQNPGGERRSAPAHPPPPDPRGQGNTPSANPQDFRTGATSATRASGLRQATAARPQKNASGHCPRARQGAAARPRWRGTAAESQPPATSQPPDSRAAREGIGGRGPKEGVLSAAKTAFAPGPCTTKRSWTTHKARGGLPSCLVRGPGALRCARRGSKRRLRLDEDALAPPVQGEVLDRWDMRCKGTETE